MIRVSNSVECFLYNVILVRRFIECAFLYYLEDERMENIDTSTCL